jgi:LPXTG-motif cell wall-anchored protein
MDPASTAPLQSTLSSSSDPASVTNRSPGTVSSSPSFQSSTILTSSTTPPSTSSTSSSSTIPPTSTTPPSTTTPPTTSAPIQITSVLTVITADSQVTTIVTSTLPFSSSSSTLGVASSTTTGADATIQGFNSTSTSTGLSQTGKTAIEVIVPIVGVALIVLALVFFWRKRKQRKDAEELRKKEVEEYGYNPNDDPTLPAVSGVKGATGDGPFEMREDGGYRGWGATTTGSSGRNASTTISGGPVGMAYSDGQSPTHGPVSDSRSGDTLIGSPTGRPASDGPEALGAMGPAASANRAGDMHRGPSNASSSYSAANRSDGSGDQPIPGGAYGQAQYYSGEGSYGGPYADTHYAAPAGRAEMGGQPVIRDNLARRATRIENPSHFPTQASAGISQNF